MTSGTPFQPTTTQASDARATLGQHEAITFAGSGIEDKLDALAGLDPQLSRFLLRDGFGGVLADATIGHREWALLTLSTLIAIGDAGDQLEVYTEAALRHGVTPEEVLDVINHASLYIGAPRAVNAARRLAAVLRHARGASGSLPTESLIRLDDHETLVWDNHGAGPAVLLIHALCMDRRMWREVYAGLAASGRVIAYDVRGHGHARAAPAATSLDQLADDAAALLDRLEVKHADLYGASYGGAIAQHVALRHPGRVRALALIATASKAPRAILAARADAAEREGMDAQVAVSLMRWFLPETIARNGWEVRYARDRVRRARVEDWAQAWRVMAQLDVLDRLAEIQIPTLVVAGQQDLSATPEYMRQTAEGLPNADYRLLDPGTHMMPLEQPVALAGELTAFRERINEAAGTRQ